VLALAGTYVLYALLAGQWFSLKWDLAFGALMFLVLLASYLWGWMGGGVVKILAVAFLWTGLFGGLPFAVLLAIFSAVHAIAAKLGWTKAQVTESGRRIPFAPAVAAALICTFILHAIQPA
jgi:prepilin peptidase CpaA